MKTMRINGSGPVLALLAMAVLAAVQADGLPVQSRPASLPIIRKLMAKVIQPQGDWAKDPKYGATLVTLHTSGPMWSVLAEAGRLGKVEISPEIQGQFNQPTVRIDADDEPLMQVVYEICAQAGWEVSRSLPAGAPGASKSGWPVPRAPAAAPSIQLMQREAGRGMGLVAVCGPVACELTHIERLIPISDDQPGGLKVVMFPRWEPKFKVLNGAGQWKLLEAVDERGNSLAMEPKYNLNARRIGANPFQFNLALDWPLAYPQENPGRRIARLRFQVSLVVEQNMEHVEIPCKEIPAQRKVGGMMLTVEPATFQGENHGDPLITYAFTLRQGDRDDIDWNVLRDVFSGVQPELLGPGGKPLRGAGSAGSGFDTTRKVVTPSWEPHGLDGKPLEPQKVVLDIPTDFKLLEIPIEFDDLPLP